jgi:hypothetical protein
MRVFISWSGEASRLAAEALRAWLPNVIQAVDPWVSGKDIDKGARWSIDVAQELERADVGILCLTPKNLEAPWILFEAGSLSKKLGKSLVCPYLLGVKPTDLSGPLLQFQAAEANDVDTFSLLQTVNHALAAAALPETTLDKVFRKWWPDLEEQLGLIDFAAGEPKDKRSERDLLEEVLALVRQVAKVNSLRTLSFWPSQACYYNIDDAIKILRNELGISSLSPAQQLLFARLGESIRESVERDKERSTSNEISQPPPADSPSG